MLTVEQLLDGRGIDYTHITGSNSTLRRSARAAQASIAQGELLGDPDG
jgi:hypothetical protein